MNYENFNPNFGKPTILTAKQYNITVSYQLENSDTSIDELMYGMITLLQGLGYHQSTINGWIKEQAASIYDDEREVLKSALSEWEVEDDENEYKDLRHSYENKPYKEFGDEDDEVIEEEPTEQYEGQFKDWESETPIEEEWDEEAAERRMDIIGQNGNEGTHYSYDWDDNIKSYEYESNDILHSINDSITIIKDKMEDMDMRMDNIDEQLGILNADVANIEYSIENPIKEKLINALAKYKNDVVDMETGEVSVDGGFDGKGLFEPYKRKPNQPVTPKKMNKGIVKKGKIKDLKK